MALKKTGALSTHEYGRVLAKEMLKKAKEEVVYCMGTERKCVQCCTKTTY